MRRLRRCLITHREQGSIHDSRTIGFGLCRSLGEKGYALFWLHPSQPGEWDATGIEMTASHNGPDFDELAVIQAQKNVDVLCRRRVVAFVHNVVGLFQSIFTATSIVHR